MQSKKNFSVGGFLPAWLCQKRGKNHQKRKSKREIEKKEQVVFLTVLFLPLGAPLWSSGPFPPRFSWAPPVFYSDYTFRIGWWRVASNVDAIVGQETDDSAFITTLFKRWEEEEAKRESGGGGERLRVKPCPGSMNLVGEAAQA
jgi:hypothetical protein